MPESKETREMAARLELKDLLDLWDPAVPSESVVVTDLRALPVRLRQKEISYNLNWGKKLPFRSV